MRNGSEIIVKISRENGAIKNSCETRNEVTWK